MTNDTLTTVEQEVVNFLLDQPTGSIGHDLGLQLRDALAKQARPEPVNELLVETLTLWRDLVQEGGIPRYTVTPEAAFNALVSWTNTVIAEASQQQDGNSMGSGRCRASMEEFPNDYEQ